MKSSIELKEMRNDIIDSLEVIKETATAEERDLTSEENDSMDSLLKNADELSAKIERAEKVETEIRNNVKLAGTPVQKVNTDKATRGWSLFKAINEVRNGGQLTGIEAEMHQLRRSRLVWIHPQQHQISKVPGGFRHRFGLQSGAYATQLLDTMYDYTDLSREKFKKEE